MSIQAVAWVLDQFVLDAAAKLVLVVLANHADHKTGRCWPTIRTIASESSQSVRSVQRKLADLQETGWITIEAFGRGLPALAAATRVWRDFAESPEAVYREGYRTIRRGWSAA